MTVLVSTPGQAADLPAGSPISAGQSNSLTLADRASTALHVFDTTNLHKFTFVRKQGESTSGWAYATLVNVGSAGVLMQKWETSDNSSLAAWEPLKPIPLDQFVAADQQFIQDWAKRSPNSATAAPDAVAETQGIACFIPDYSFQVDTSGVLKGKTITAIASSADHFLALCADGTLVAWGQNLYGQLGNGRHGEDALSLAPVLVDETGALKGKTVTSIGAYKNGSYALCADGSLYTWGLPPIDFSVRNSTAVPDLQDKPALLGSRALQGKKILAVSATRDGALFSLLCADGSLFDWQPVGHGHTDAVCLSDQGILRGKKITLIGDGNKALCADGTLVRWNSMLIRHSLSVSFEINPVIVTDETKVLKGKTISAFLEGDRVLCSDGTVADLGPGDFGHGADDKNLYPRQINVPVPTGRKLTSIAGALCLYSGGKLDLLPLPSDRQERTDSLKAFVAALRGKTIQAITPNLVLFKAPAAIAARPPQ